MEGQNYKKVIDGRTICDYSVHGFVVDNTHYLPTLESVLSFIARENVAPETWGIVKDKEVVNLIDNEIKRLDEEFEVGINLNFEYFPHKYKPQYT